ncbi:unnamed protein product [Cylicocyclus nassatus]|uniref:Uncharacterized protein n=1 Tax=Cylicocyclus nassatus TaxID=53992 RepID=A0AA36GHI8_CYLNA|nr:unnamed protein product [Cylicocyclus nassatus]
MIERLLAYLEQCDKSKALLEEWLSHRIKLEAKLRKLARQFDKWELEFNSVKKKGSAAISTEAEANISAGTLLA